eukprot:TRINITY_DN1242_c0_g1_i1.p6 TRINITY_DN1242_c0_g1~~TRINITY_DN1242_c0_g1_i1.p6  ORF type:complete len:431 (-),score=58.71 TRINITY_DN1242_c0_g1_i1:40-1332(-)
MKFLAVSSSAAVAIAGLLVLVCWIIVAHDDKAFSGECGGCIRMLHKALGESSNLSDDLIDYYKLHKNAYPLLVAFGVICALCWFGTSALAFIRAKYYLIAGALSTVLFVCVFAPILDRIRNDQPCSVYQRVKGTSTDAWIDYGCKTEDNWMEKHRYDSYDLFWGSSLACLLLAVYQIACAVPMVYEEQGVGEEARALQKPAEPQQQMAPSPVAPPIAPPAEVKKEAPAPPVSVPTPEQAVKPPPEAKEQVIKTTPMEQKKEVTKPLMEPQKEVKAAPQEVKVVPPAGKGVEPAPAAPQEVKGVTEPPKGATKVEEVKEVVVVKPPVEEKKPLVEEKKPSVEEKKAPMPTTAVQPAVVEHAAKPGEKKEEKKEPGKLPVAELSQDEDFGAANIQDFNIDIFYLLYSQEYIVSIALHISLDMDINYLLFVYV